MWDKIADIGKAFGGWDKIGDFVGGVGSLWGAYNQSKMAKKNFKMQQDAFNFNKALQNREIRRQDENDKRLATGYSNSLYAGQ